ncbi:Uncharacterized protein OBRU01_13767 [Operophtera brumata]|uniref:FLYWCH-type domain-containing protein n=1 Tax=Operophtera brumata TaxID=104452 RepID=A0A0L7L7P5_OPEBR|nr:Uncharacterized protein OBRU01_13767 [Operophtera brumata]
MQNPKNVNQQSTRWRCCKWSSFHCRATIITVDTQIVKVVNRHNHPAEDFGLDIMAFSLSKFGKPVLLLNGYRYNLHHQRSSGPKKRWLCCKWSSNGFTVILTSNKVTYTVTRFGKPAMLLGGYRYNLNNKSKSLRRWWTCTRNVSRMCKASVTTFNNQIIKLNNVHNH